MIRKKGKLKIKKLQAVLTKEEVFKILGMMESERDRILFKMLYYTGMRVTEIISLRHDDLNFTENVIRIRPETTKTKREALQPMPKPLIDDLKRFSNTKRHEIWLFPSASKNNRHLTKQRVWQLVKYYGKKAKINKDIHPHTFRHTYGTHIYEETSDLGKVQELLRHQSLASTGIYKHLSKTLKKKTVDEVFR